MWGLTLSPIFPSGLNLLLSLSPLSWLLFLVVCWQSYVLFSVVVKLKNLKGLSTNKELISDSSDSKSELGSKVQTIFPSVNIRRVVAMILVAVSTALLVGMMANRQRGMCVATGDISHSDGMTVLSKFSPHCYWVKGKDGVTYKFCVNPTTQTDWQPGAFVELADYEYRDGFADFTIPGGRLKVWEEGVLHESRW